MGLSLDEMREISRNFQKKYMMEGPLGSYINMVGVSSIAIKSKGELTLDPDEDPNDYCLSVGFSRWPPDSLAELPDRFEGARVFYNLLGTIRPC